MSRGVVVLALILLSLILSLISCDGRDVNVATQHNDKSRTGAYLFEKVLTPKAVRERGMHQKYFIGSCEGFRKNRCLNGDIVTQPLYVRQVHFPPRVVSGINANAVTTNTIFVGTQKNHVYALNADTGDLLWEIELRDKADPLRNMPRGVNSTPVIDVTKNRMYVLFSTRRQIFDPNLVLCKDPNGKPIPIDECDWRKYLVMDADVAYWLVVLDIGNGTELARRQVSASALRAGGTRTVFEARKQMDRPGLLLDHGSIYIAFGSIAGIEGKNEYHGWVMRYRADDLAPQGSFCTSPTPPTKGPNCNGERLNNPNLGSGIWQGGGGLAADSDGNVYLLTGNGRADFGLHFENNQLVRHKLFGNSMLRLTPSGQTFKPLAFAPPEADCLEYTDADLGSGGAMLIPDSKVVIGGGKSGIMYLLDRSTMELIQDFPASTNQYHPERRIQAWDSGPHLHGSPTYWRGPDPVYGYLYVWGEKDFLKLYRFDTRTQTIEETRFGPDLPRRVRPFRRANILALEIPMPGGMLSVSADGTKKGTGIVWATLPDSDCPPGKFCPKSGTPPFAGRLYAFDAETLQLLWHSGFGLHPHWVPPTIADGLVFMATGGEGFIVYELGSPTGSDRVTGEVQPQPTRHCEGCHTEDERRRLLATLKPLHDRYDDEASIRARPANALRQLAPPRGSIRNLVLEGNGVQFYESTEDAFNRGAFIWTLKETTGELRAQRDPSYPSVEVRISAGNTWSASDGSTIAGELQALHPAPESTDAPWTLYNVVKRSGEGILAHQTHVQCVYTHAGRAPTPPPKRAGMIVRVPFHAQYWFYGEGLRPVVQPVLQHDHRP